MSPGGLSSSRWAASSISPLTSWPRPRPASSVSPSRLNPNPNPNPNDASRSSNSGIQARPLPEQELSRFLKIVARLNWKLPFLNQGYATATNREGIEQQDIEAREIHFKIDFHEYYMLIERALVHLMGVYGITVHAQHGMNGAANRNSHPNVRPNDYLNVPPSGTAATNMNIKPGSLRERICQHRYHANVLAALDDPDNPLYEIFGAVDVRKQLSRAKDLRNRWKNADDADSGNAGPRRFMPAPLEAYNLEQIIQTLFAAFDRAFIMAERYVRERGAPANAADWTTEADDWEFMVDAMDWEAV